MPEKDREERQNVHERSKGIAQEIWMRVWKMQGEKEYGVLLHRVHLSHIAVKAEPLYF